jgi:ribosomal protein L2
LYNNPKEKGLQKPTATEGTKVQILQTVKGSILNVGKYKVQLPSGKVAWVEQQCMGTLATN